MERSEWKNIFEKTPQSFHTRVQSTLAGLPERETISMKKTKFTLKKAAVFAIVAVLAVGSSVFAASKMTSVVSSSDNRNDFTTLPSASEIREKCGFTSKYVTAFSNGYTFASGNIGNVAGYDDDKNKTGAAKNLYITYKNQDSTVELSITGMVTEDLSDRKETPVDYNNLQIYYQKQDYKFEPADYKLTPTDQADEKSGKYVFSYGSEKEEIDNFQSVTWIENGKEYNLQAENSALQKQELLQMAQEVVNAEEK